MTRSESREEARTMPIPDWNAKKWFGAVVAVVLVGVIVSGALSPAPVQDVSTALVVDGDDRHECLVTVDTAESAPPVVVQTGSEAVVIEDRRRRSVTVRPGTELRVRVVRYGSSTATNYVTGMLTADCDLQEINKQ